MESFRFWDEDDYECEIFSILSEPARESASFWRENVMAVVILLRVSEQMSKQREQVIKCKKFYHFTVGRGFNLL